MNFKDILTETLSGLTANKGRSLLTVLGIVIGIASVIIVLAVGNGAKASIESRISSLGTNLLTVSPGAGGSRAGTVSVGRGVSASLKEADVEALLEEKILFSHVSPEVSKRTQVIGGEGNTNTQVYGVTPVYQSVKSLEMAQGVFFDETLSRFAKVVILGPTTRDDLFGVNEEVIGKTVRIGSARFTVIGVTVPKGGTGFGSQDDRVYMPLDTAQQYIIGSKSLSSISISVSDSERMTEAQNKAKEILMLSRNIKEEDSVDFSIFNQADLAETASSITGTLTALLGSVAGISLIVGGIGIMNMMLTTVRERTREIGLRKAIGAKKGDISKQFLLEAIALTIFGGLVGVTIGITVSLLFSLSGLIAASVTVGPILLAFGVSATTGIVFGYYPAKKASELNPIEALRYE
ncbi:MAG: ABC transporter permease [Candidatus Pacebacteria bacterium]|nr:ABC transporter permease [Candidatus Paceibacterota bacterium]